MSDRDNLKKSLGVTVATLLPAIIAQALDKPGVGLADFVKYPCAVVATGGGIASVYNGVKYTLDKILP